MQNLLWRRQRADLTETLFVSHFCKPWLFSVESTSLVNHMHINPCHKQLLLLQEGASAALMANLTQPRQRVSMRNCLHWMSLWPCLWGSFNWYTKTKLTVQYYSLGRRFWTLQNWRDFTEHKEYTLLSLCSWLVMWLSIWSPHCLDFPTVKACDLELWAKEKKKPSFPLWCSLLGYFFPNNRNWTKHWHCVI